MRSVFKLFAVGVSFLSIMVSCSEKDLYVEEEKEYIPEVEVDYETVNPSTFLSVPVKEGFVTQVVQNGEVVFQTKEATVLEVSKNQFSAFTRADENYRIEYVPADAEQLSEFTTSAWQCYKTILFEDLLLGSDYDYNDLIIHTRQSISGNQVKIYAKGIAMGGELKITLGAKLYVIDAAKNIIDDDEFVFTTDAKKDFFGEEDKTLFINTTVEPKDFTLSEMYNLEPIGISTNGKKYISYKEDGSGFLPKDMSGKTCVINWYIISEKYPDNKLYAVPPIDNDESINWVTEKGYPYGLVITKIRDQKELFYIQNEGLYAGYNWINFPKERVHIEDVFVGFKAWLEGGVAPNWNKPVEGKYVDAINTGVGETTTVRCLYDIGQHTSGWNKGKSPQLKNLGSN